MKTILLLTGCVVPNCVDNLCVRDAEIRKGMYIDSIKWYLSNTPYDIVFCENSGTDLSSYLPKDGRLEFLTFTAPDNSSEAQSRSSRELAIIKYAYENSAKIAPGNLFVKITGRLKYLNIVETADRILLTASVQCANKEYIGCAFFREEIYSDSRCFFFTYPFFKRMLDKQSVVSDKFPFERMLGVCVYQMLKRREGVFSYIPLPQRISGKGAGMGNEYDITDEQYRKSRIKHVFVKLLFDLKFFPRLKKSQTAEYDEI